MGGFLRFEEITHTTFYAFTAADISEAELRGNIMSQRSIKLNF